MLGAFQGAGCSGSGKGLDVEKDLARLDVARLSLRSSMLFQVLSSRCRQQCCNTHIHKEVFKVPLPDWPASSRVS